MNPSEVHKAQLKRWQEQLADPKDLAQPVMPMQLGEAMKELLAKLIADAATQ